MQSQVAGRAGLWPPSLWRGHCQYPGRPEASPSPPARGSPARERANLGPAGSLSLQIWYCMLSIATAPRAALEGSGLACIAAGLPQESSSRRNPADIVSLP